MQGLRHGNNVLRRWELVGADGMKDAFKRTKRFKKNPKPSATLTLDWLINTELKALSA